MKIAFFSSKAYDHQFFQQANQSHQREMFFFDAQLNLDTAILAEDCPVICLFVNDQAPAPVLEKLAAQGTKLIALRSAGYNNVDLKTAADLGLKVVHVPSYSPHAVAEHTVGLILALNRKLYRAYNRVRDDNFSLEGLLGFDLHGTTVGVIGTGKIGLAFAQIMNGFGCHLLGYDAFPNDKFTAIGQALYVSLNELLAHSDIISLHCPLLPETHYLINTNTIAQMKPGVMLINTSRGHLIDTQAVIQGIKSHKIGFLGIDVYEEEEELFFTDHSNTIIQDDTFQLLQSFPNVMITAHQGFFTHNALQTIAATTLANIAEFEQNKPLTYQVMCPH
ncbi:2-hydroxyacid dehydrogenase [Synechocystis sp. CACIAM 05]|uniref:2-hydroxyacid dehydrogenase n=1 Tax=Synechocystis sp. CACIAM 05 TaxID=1933929 RepID=UPI00138E7CB5|nr:2-hydroxyacid dehydrogenase [Synechocystis sp. CACIAM 05]QHV01393.1 hydroxyacid dehydrogenase [Synechocystis sp. CACIAM 05]